MNYILKNVKVVNGVERFDGYYAGKDYEQPDTFNISYSEQSAEKMTLKKAESICIRLNNKGWNFKIVSINDLGRNSVVSVSENIPRENETWLIKYASATDLNNTGYRVVRIKAITDYGYLFATLHKAGDPENPVKETTIKSTAYVDVQFVKRILTAKGSLPTVPRSIIKEGDVILAQVSFKLADPLHNKQKEYSNCIVKVMGNGKDTIFEFKVIYADGNLYTDERTFTLSDVDMFKPIKHIMDANGENTNPIITKEIIK